MRATLSYTLLRVLIFFAVALILALFGVHGLTLIAVALIVSAIISVPVLSRLRAGMSTSLANWMGKFRGKLDEGTRSEDVD
jgi:preprotein translocase subunit SecF